MERRKEKNSHSDDQQRTLAGRSSREMIGCGRGSTASWPAGARTDGWKSDEKRRGEAGTECGSGSRTGERERMGESESIPRRDSKRLES
jgi:hypothetical protein